jgi:NADPH:quinone reductase
VRAIVVREAGDSSVLKLEELPAPSPGPGEVTIDVAFAGTGFVDTLA